MSCCPSTGGSRDSDSEGHTVHISLSELLRLHFVFCASEAMTYGLKLLKCKKISNRPGLRRSLRPLAGGDASSLTTSRARPFR